jgi:hypothetical protein
VPCVLVGAVTGIDSRVMMREVSIGNVHYRVAVEERGGRLVAHAERSDSGDRFGIECAGATEEDAAARLVAWLNWQHEHAVALDALRLAEQACHRTIAGSALARALEGPSAEEMHRESLEELEAARVTLDEIRARRPD